MSSEIWYEYHPSREFGGFELTRSFKDKHWWGATYVVYDLWEKDEEGKWGQSLGAMSEGVRGVPIATHQTKVWKLVPVSQPLRKRGRHAHRPIP